VSPGQMTGGAIKPAAQHRLLWERWKLADQQQKHFLSCILGQCRITKDALAGGLDHRSVQPDELRARRLAQGKLTIPDTLRPADLAFAYAITSHTILLPHRGKLCEKNFPENWLHILLAGVRGGLMADTDRLMESPLSLFRRHWDDEPAVE